MNPDSEPRYSVTVRLHGTPVIRAEGLTLAEARAVLVERNTGVDGITAEFSPSRH